jgi:hypothetical protein
MSTARYVVWSFEHRLWWGPGRCGYTPDLELAGRYTAEEAGRIVTDSMMGEEVALHEATAKLHGHPTVEGLWAGSE